MTSTGLRGVGAAVRRAAPAVRRGPNARHTAAVPTRHAYLPGLDGVRALAVAAVLAYHFQAPFAPGGFLGVDVFFVLSGYLISSQLWSRWALDGPRLKIFWLGRLRRLLPAVLALALLVGVAMLAVERDQLGTFAGDLGAAATYTSNWWYVLHQRSYFEAAGRPPALQHLWSLAVEEQFYVLWPLVVIGVFGAIRRPRGRRNLLVATSLLLAALSALVMGLGSALTHTPEQGDPSRWYFGTDSHAMGLLLGAALAFSRGGAGFGRLMPPLRPASQRATRAGAAALVLLLLVLATVDEFSVVLYRIGFPLVSAITVVLVAVVARPGPLQRLFSVHWLRYLGQRSYGLYLWHWPVAVFTRPHLDLPLDGPVLFLLRVTLSLVLAELSFQLVEKPVRAHGWRRPWQGMEWRLPTFRTALLQLVVGLCVTIAAVPVVAALPQSWLGTAPAVETHSDAPQRAPRIDPAQVTPRRDLSVTVYGDSVAEGAAPAFERYFGQVTNHAKVAEHSWDMLPAIAADARAGRIHSDVVVINTGDNGLIPDDALKDALGALKDVRAVVVLTPKTPRSWEKRAVQTILDVAPAYANVQIARWDEFAQGHDEWFVDDGIHLQPGGQDAYLRLILSAASPLLPPAPPGTATAGTAAGSTGGATTDSTGGSTGPSTGASRGAGTASPGSDGPAPTR